MDTNDVNRNIWQNGCSHTVPAALRFLAENRRPDGGSSPYNTEHLYQLAEEIEAAVESTIISNGDWESNAKYLLDKCPYAVRVCEGGGSEDLMDSLIVTFMKMQHKLAMQA